MKQVWPRCLLSAAALSLLVHAGCDRTSRLDDPAGVRLNEVMAQNVSVPVPDASGTPVTLNWVEIHNTLSTSMSLGRYGLTDRHDDPFRFRFPVGTLIPPGGFLVVFLLDPEDCLADCEAAAADCGEDPVEQAACAAELAECNSRCNPSGLVTGFNLNDAGEALFLFSPDGKLLGRAGVQNQPEDVSNGIDPVSGEYGVIYQPTPGGPNGPVGRKPLRFSSEPRATNPQVDGADLIIDFTVDADAPADVPIALVDEEFVPAVTGCPEPGVGAVTVEADLLDETLTTVTRTDGFPPRTVDIVRWSFQATLPGGSCGQRVAWRVTVRGQEELIESSCTTLCLEIPTLLINEYQPQNANYFFVRKRDSNIVDPDWIEIVNFGDKEVNVEKVGLVGRSDLRQQEFSRWLLGKHGGITEICAGGTELVLAHNDDGKFRDEYALSGDTSGKFPFRSTRFNLDPQRDVEPDRFALVLPLEPDNATSTSGGEIIDEVVLSFAPGQYKAGQSAGRSKAEGLRRHALMPGTIFDAPSPVFESQCESGPNFSPGVAVDTKSGLRCPDPGDPATLRVRVSFDEDTPENQVAAELRFRLNGGAETVAPLALALTKDPSTSTLYEGSAVIPGQPADTLVTFSFAAFDRRLEGLDGVRFEDIHSPETDPTSSFQYLVGSRPVGPVRLNEVLPENTMTMLPFTEVLPESQKGFLPEYIELHNSSAAPASLEGFHLTDTLDRARLFRFPAGAVVPPGGFLNVYLGPVPPSLCDCALPPEACGPDTQPCPVGPYIGVESFDFVSEKDEGAVYLVAPDSREAGANCVVDSLSWSLEPPAGFEGDLAAGRICDGAEKVVQLASPTPEASNVLAPIVHDAYHKLITTSPKNICVPENAIVQLNIVLFLESTFRELMRGTPGLFTATFFVNRGSGEETITIVDLADLPRCDAKDLSARDCADPPRGFSAVVIRPRAPILPPFAATVSYRAVVNACGVSTDAGPFTFGTAAGEHPQVALNEINRFHPVLPGQPARPWIEVWNHGTTEVDLSGMFLSDNPSNPRKTRFPDGTRIPGRSAVLVLTSGSASPPAIGIPLNWPREKGSLLLLDSEARGTCAIDTFPFDFTGLDTRRSLGRIPDGTGAIMALAEPSPGIGNEAPAAAFIRGDANSDLRVNISDMIRALGILFGGETSRPACEDALDANDDGSINGADPVHIGNFIFLLGPPIPPPYPLPGEDPTPDGIPACGAMIR